MPVTEIVTPSLKQDEATRSTFEGTILPYLLNMISSAPGAKSPFIGPILTENGKDISSELKYALGLEWETAQNFYDFLASPEFQAFGAQVKPLSAAPPTPQIFDTDLIPYSTLSAPLTEVFRIKINNGGNELGIVRDAWTNFIASIKSSFPAVHSLSGTSLNAEQELFLGIVGWDGAEVRNQVLGETGVNTCKTKLEGLDGVDSFTFSSRHH